MHVVSQAAQVELKSGRVSAPACSTRRPSPSTGPTDPVVVSRAAVNAALATICTCRQGRTLVHFSAQCTPFLWDRGCS